MQMYERYSKKCELAQNDISRKNAFVHKHYRRSFVVRGLDHLMLKRRVAEYNESPTLTWCIRRDIE